MKIAMFTNNYKPFIGGVPIAVETLAGQLRRNGHRVFIFAPEYDPPAQPEPDVFRIWSIRNFNATAFSLPLPLWLDVQLRFAQIGPDIVHVHHPFLLGQTGLHLGGAYDMPVVFTYHTQYEKYAHYMPFEQNMVIELAVKLSARFANCCDTIIAPSDDIKRMLAGRGVKTPVRVIPSGIDLSRFASADRAPNKRIRERHAIPPDAPVLLFVGRLAHEKNCAFLLNAFELISRDAPQARLVLVGSGDAEEELRAAAAAMKCAPRIIFTGALTGSMLDSAYLAGDIFVFSSTTETQGMVVAEAMAAGLPVVAVDGPGVRETVKTELNGFLVAPGDTDGFARRVTSLLADDELRARLGRGAHASSREYSLEITARNVEEVYRQAMRMPHVAREERFILLREVVSYQFERLKRGMDSFLL
ncbi:MAG: glycosyltransferase [bacterium]|nr:glycosyltransferase [Candidatus Sumerlaeota bacterium]